MKQTLKLFLSLLFLAIGTQVWADNSGTCGDDVVWSFDSATGTMTIWATGEGHGVMDNYGGMSGQPWQSLRYNIKTVVIEGSVKVVGEHAFDNYDNITKLIVKDGVERLERSCFLNCTNLATADVAPSVYFIGESSFNGILFDGITDDVLYVGNVAYKVRVTRSSYTTFELKEGCTGISARCFEDTGVTKVVIPNTVKSIGMYAFQDCKNIVSLELPNSLVWLDNSAFARCYALESVTVPGSVGYLRQGVFSDCKALTTATLGEGITGMGPSAFSGCVALTSIELPNTLEVIEQSCFYNCASLESITLPNSVTTIGEGAFSSCGKLATINFSENLEDIGKDALSSTAWYKKLPNGMIYVNNVAFEYKGDMPANTSIELKEGCTGVAARAFYYKKNLVSVSIPNTVKVLGRNAFYECGGLQKIEIPASVRSIGYEAFYKCTNATSLLIHKGVEKIDGYAFSGCSKLTNAVIPDGVTDLGYGIFYNCGSLTSVVIGKGATMIGGYFFHGCGALTSVQIPDGVTSVGSYAFGNCYKLMSVTLPSTLTKIEANGFYNQYNNSNFEHIYVVTPEDKLLYVNNQKTLDTDGLFDLKTIGNMKDAKTLVWKPAFRVFTDQVLGDECAIQYFTDYKNGNLSNEVESGLKVLNETGDQTVYVKATAPKGFTLFPENLRISTTTATGETQPIQATALADDVLSFTMPSNPVKVAAEFVNGGYCGETIVNGGLNVRWRIYADDAHDNGYKLIVSGDGNMRDFTEGGHELWDHYSELTTVVIEEGITRVGNSAFLDQFGLLSLQMANSVKDIGSYAFHRTSYLESDNVLTMPRDLEYVGEYAFYGSNPSAMDFSGCLNLKDFDGMVFHSFTGKILLPSVLEQVNASAFNLCHNVWFVVPDDKALFFDGSPLPVVDGLSQIPDFGYKGRVLALDWRDAYSVDWNLKNDEGCSVALYTEYDGTSLFNEIGRGYKVMPESTNTMFYISLGINEGKMLSVDGLTVANKTDGQPISLTEVAQGIYSFRMPEAPISINGEFVFGGYCGDPSVNEGRDTRWQIDDSMTLKIYGTGKVDSREWVKDKYPWRTVKAIEVCEGVTSLPESSFNGVNYGTGNEQAVPITLPSTLEEIGAFSFRYCVGNVDMSKCTKMIYIGESVLCCLYGDVLLSPTIARVSANALWGDTEGPQHIYVPVASDQALLVNGEQLKDVNGKVDLISIWPSLQYKHDESEDFFLSLHKGYYVSAAANSNGVLKVYADQALTQEIPAGFKAIRDNDNTPIYVKVTPSDTKILFKSGLTVNGKSGSIAVTQIDDEVFSFMMPAEPVEASAQFSTGGYCGTASVNNGHNLIWTLEDGTLAFHKNSFAQGNDVSMGNNAPWSTLGTSITEVDLDGVSSIGNDAFSSCTRLTGIELPASPILTVGTNAFAKQMWIIVPSRSWKSYQAASGWSAYGEQMAKDKETLALKDGQQWLTYYSKVGRMLPEGIKAYTITDVTEDEAIASEPLNYIPAHQAVLIENRQKTAGTIEATTSILPNAQSEAPVCLLTTGETNLLQWLTEPTPVKVGQGYILYKDEFVKVSTGTLPADIAFLSIQGVAASRLSIFNAFDDDEEVTGVDVVKTDVESGKWYTIDGKKLSGRPTKKGLYVKDGQKVVIR